jgi:transcriptional antiterminator RfaH
VSYWAVARTLIQRESFAADRLTEIGFNVFLPKLETARSIEPLFRNYLFLEIVDAWHVVDRTLGVMKLVRFGETPAVCPDAEIAALRARTDADGVIRLPPKVVKTRRRIAAGTPVRIIGGPFQGLAAVHAGMSAAEREFVLISIMGGARRVAVPSHLVEVPSP